MHIQVIPDICAGNFFILNEKVQEKSRFPDKIAHDETVFYEVLKIENGVPLFTADHLDRLMESLRNKGAANFPPVALISDNMRLLITHNNKPDKGNIRILLRYKGGLDKSPDILCHFAPHYYPSDDERHSGVKLVLANAERINVHSKIVNTGFREAIERKIRQGKAYEALLVSRQGQINEGSKSNFFAVRGNKVLTPPEEDVLPGITRKYIIEICRNSGIEIAEQRIHKSELTSFESCFITGTSPGILAVRKIGSIDFNPANPVLKSLSAKYRLLVDRYIELNKSQYLNAI